MANVNLDSLGLLSGLTAISNKRLQTAADSNAGTLDSDINVEMTFFCRALYDYRSQDKAHLPFRAGDIIEVLGVLESGWWDGLLNDRRGWFPSNHVQVIDDAEAEREFRRRDPYAHWPTDDERRNVSVASDLRIPQLTELGYVYHLNAKPGKETRGISEEEDLKENPRIDHDLVEDPKLQLLEILHKLSHLDVKNRIKILTRAKAMGASCDVFTGELDDGTRHVKVAIKKLRIFWDRERPLAKTLVKEAYIWSKLRHSNVLPLLGFFLDDDDYPHLVSMWMAKGTLFDYLKILEPGAETMRMAEGIAAGMAYLHKQNIVHADLKSPNVLISDNDRPLITDFGVSIIMAASETVMCGTTASSIKGTVRWTAIELFLDEDDETESATATKKSDVWAFGMVIYEILSRKLPYDRYKTDGQVISAILKGVLPQVPLHHVLRDVCQKCWAKEPDRRPSMFNIRRIISEYGEREGFQN